MTMSTPSPTDIQPVDSTDPSAVRRTPLVPWGSFMDQLVWNPGEHVALIGPTGQGKTNFLYWFLPRRKFITIFATKPHDASMTHFGKTKDFVIWKTWKNDTARKVPRRILWPKATDLYSIAHQRTVFKDALYHIYGQGGWTLALDELYFIVQTLGLGNEVKIYLLQARALDISLVCATQRPSWVPLEVYDQSTHLFFWRDNDERNLKRLSGISFNNAAVIRQIIANLPKYHVLYVNTRTGDMAITRPPAPRKVKTK